MTPTVDSGASDTVIPPCMLSWLEILYAEKVGTEYEVANGEVVHNLGERRRMMRITEKSQDELEIAFQVVEDVHTSLLAVRSIIRQGHQLVVALEKPHVLLSSGVKIPMRHVHGTYELDVLVKKPGFTRKSTT